MPEGLPKLDLLELIVFDTVRFQTLPPDILAHNAMMRHSKALPLERWELLVAECIDKGWLHCLDDAAVRDISAICSGFELVCDAEERPKIGDIDFTSQGAQVYKGSFHIGAGPEFFPRLDAPAARVRSGTESNDCEVEVYMARLTSVTEALYSTGEGWACELAGRPVVSTTQPEVVGAWGKRWWNLHPAGYRVRAVISPHSCAAAEPAAAPDP